MSATKPSVKDRLEVKFWKTEKCLEELRRHALAGHTEWVVLLLETTKYATLPKIFTHGWWLIDTTPESKPDRVEVAVKVVKGLLQKLNPKHLPKAVARVWPTTTAERRQLILKLSGPGPVPLRRTKP